MLATQGCGERRPAVRVTGVNGASIFKHLRVLLAPAPLLMLRLHAFSNMHLRYAKFRPDLIYSFCYVCALFYQFLLRILEKAI